MDAWLGLELRLITHSATVMVNIHTAQLRQTRLTVSEEAWMNKLAPERINHVQARASHPAVSIYMPAHRSATPVHMREDETRLKKLTHRASGILDTIDKHAAFNKTFAKQCEKWLSEESFWKERAGSILLCAQGGQFEIFDLPIDTDEYVAVDDHYHLAPVYGLLEDSTPFYVLALTIRNAYLFVGDEYGLELTMQNSKDDIVNTEAGHHPYFRRVAIEFFAKLDKSIPLILVGVSDNLTRYRSLNDYPRLLDQAISGSYGPDDADKLFAAGRKIVNKSIVEARHKERLTNYHNLIGEGSERASNDIANIKDAAEHGRVDTLFIGMSRVTTDTVEDLLEPTKKIVFPDEIESQVIDRISQTVWSQRGHIMNITEDQVPSSAVLHALYRY